MAEIVDMPDVALKCPCGKELVLKWQQAHHADEGGDTPQFLRLELEYVPYVPIEKRKITKYQGSSLKAFRLFNDTEVSEGGWVDRKWLTKKELVAAEKRWVAHSYGTGKQEPDVEKGWIPHQCGGCRTFAALDLDYGLCCNEKSPNDGRITFEHGGCKFHSDYEEQNA